MKLEEEGVALADLFADDDYNTMPTPAATLATMSDLSNPFVMLTYYRNLFPFPYLFKWLNHDPTRPTPQFTHREFAMNLPNDVYIRYCSYQDHQEMKREVLRLNPARFEIGPVYTARPKDKKVLMKQAFKPKLRELVFDIDMTDYDSIRTCCQDKAMCNRCWRFIVMAVKVLDETLRHDFNFQHLLWVYSGRRGIHCWVSDPAALALSDEQRRAIVNYIEVIKGDKKVSLARPLHPMLGRAFDTLKAYFSSVVLQDQDCFQHQKQWENILAQLPDKEHAEKLRRAFDDSTSSSTSTSTSNAKVAPSPSTTTSSERWAALLKVPAKSDAHQVAKHKDAVVDIILQYTYPRIDTEVSKKLNHLLKSPFCVHPGTGRVCVPLLASQIDTFDPSSVPTVGQLLMELEELSLASASGGGVDDKEKAAAPGWERTSLKPYVELFARYCKGLEKEVLRVKREDQAVSMEF